MDQADEVVNILLIFFRIFTAGLTVQIKLVRSLSIVIELIVLLFLNGRSNSSDQADLLRSLIMLIELIMKLFFRISCRSNSSHQAGEVFANLHLPNTPVG